MTWSNIPWNPSSRTLRQFAGLWILFFGGFALTSFLRHGDPPFVWVVGALAIVVGTAGLLQPALIRPIFITWMIAVFPIGWVVHHVSLALIFFCLFTPMAVLFRFLKRDLLDLRRQPERTSYWYPKKMPTSLSQYYRTF